MSTIEKALEKQRQLAEKLRQKEADAAARASTQMHPLEPPAPPSPPTVEVAPHPAEPIKTEANEQPSSGLDKPVIEIDVERLDELGFVTPTERFSKIKEEYRYIKRPLLNNAFGATASTLRNPNLIMVSSSFSGEGKTFTAVNLAISMALEQDRNVLLIDADVVHPHVCERLGIEERPGLLDFLRGNLEVTDIIYDTSIPKLKLVTAGTRHHHASEMLASEKMKRLMTELSTRYSDRVVIFDTSPLLGASETNVLSQNAGQAVVVVEQGRTTHQQLEQALRLLNPEIATNLILNKSNAGRSEYYGYYYANN
ncbi:XrtA-associated tyrosine autokinase [Motiliproteus sediminis]|uniref:XrtA-associated tyrosine autokinase n=1 Tax=Motiliproteus sediminis TaxID=1468178 RepID=UPI001AF00874|nr:XrtA-associated tyrosine autokinase [Motiliproteus sediminis]